MMIVPGYTKVETCDRADGGGWTLFGYMAGKLNGRFITTNEN